MITDQELSEIRSAAAEFLPDAATIQRRTLTADGNGGKIASYATVGTASCRIVFAGSKDEPTQKDRAEGGRITPQVNYIVTLAHDADVRETDRLVINGSTYETLSPATTRSYEVSKRFLVKKL